MRHTFKVKAECSGKSYQSVSYYDGPHAMFSRPEQTIRIKIETEDDGRPLMDLLRSNKIVPFELRLRRQRMLIKFRGFVESVNHEVKPPVRRSNGPFERATFEQKVITRVVLRAIDGADLCQTRL